MCPVRFGNSFYFDSFFDKQQKNLVKNVRCRKILFGLLSYFFVNIKNNHIKNCGNLYVLNGEDFVSKFKIFLINKNLQKICLCS